MERLFLREYLLEYNLVLREWSAIIKKMLSGKEKLISIFRTTPNIRIKFAKDLESNKEKTFKHVISALRCVGRRALGNELLCSDARRYR